MTHIQAEIVPKLLEGGCVRSYLITALSRVKISHNKCVAAGNKSANQNSRLPGGPVAINPQCPQKGIQPGAAQYWFRSSGMAEVETEVPCCSFKGFHITKDTERLISLTFY